MLAFYNSSETVEQTMSHSGHCEECLQPMTNYIFLGFHEYSLPCVIEVDLTIEFKSL